MHPEIRFQISASCRFWWCGASGAMNFATGTTRDLGSGGVCVIAEVLPLLGARIMLEVDLPRAADPFGQLRPDLLYRAEGIVVQHRKGLAEFVATITNASLDRGGQSEQSKRREEDSDAPN
jgi:hypothetical protein